MANVPIEDVKRLRELTGAGITDAKKALVEASGDFDKALAAMRKAGMDSAIKRAGREAAAGLIETYSHDGRIGVVIEVNCETDFVARTDEFKTLVKDLTLHIAASEPADVTELSKQPFVKEPDITVGDYVSQAAAKLGENVVVRRFERLELGQLEK